ncbi:uncharacterized protein EAF01_007768 [Botrytis porri]|uniref:Uncharacterized protein n=1 Tax=Botrytis porri TaxID=87229 RepID=A0A4Z1L5M8_9HELO|nr:uncharacterized protein EAF01_007768 [Botrytis porri]KAF7900466.1 hypothetical protein EAF01_007768 [Botrytis porri]TGO92122.1 hypothetical protein BPOR_0009g00010 [Botrytis porri]
MSGHNNTNDIGANDNEQDPHNTGTNPPINQYDHHASNVINNSFNPHQQGTDGRQMAPNNNQSGLQVVPVDLTNPQSQVLVFDSPYLHGGDQLPNYHTHNRGYTVDPQIPASYPVNLALINHDQVPPWPVYHGDNNGYIMDPHMPAYQEVEGPPINHDQQVPQSLVYHGAPINHGQQVPPSLSYHEHPVNPQMLACHQFEGSPINHVQQPQLPINSNHHQPQLQAQDLSYIFGQQQTQVQDDYMSDIERSISQQAFVDPPFQSALTDFGQPLSMPVHAADYSGHDMSQQAPAHFPVGGDPTHLGPQPQMHVNQTNFSPVNNNQQAYQGMATTAVSSFANQSAQEQDAEFQHFVQQRLALGEVQLMEFETFKAWYIGQQLQGNITPTIEHGVTPLDQALVLNNDVAIQQSLILPNNQERMQPPPMIYQNRGELTTGFQHTMPPPTTLSLQAMKPNSEPYLQQPQESIDSDVQARRTSLAITSSGQSFLPVSSPSMALPALSLTTTMAAPPSITRAQAPSLTTTVPAPSVPAFTRRNQKLKNEKPPQMGKKTCATGKRNSREQKTEATPAIQQTSIPIDQILSPTGNYTVSLAYLPPVFDSREPFDVSAFTALTAGAENIDRQEKRKSRMRMTQGSSFIVKMALREMLQQSIVHLSLETSPGARTSVPTKDADKPEIKLLLFASKSQFVVEEGEEDAKVVRGKEQIVKPARDGDLEFAKHTFKCRAINIDLNGIEVEGSYSLYTKTSFVNANTPLKYAIGLEIMVTEVGKRIARDNLLTYERSLPSQIAGEPVWADIIDLLKLQATEWDTNTGNQDPPAFQTSTSTSPSNQQQNDKEEQLPSSGPVQGQRARTRQSITPEPRSVRGEKRKQQQQPELHASPVIFVSSSEANNSSSDQANSPISNASTDRTSVSPQLLAEPSRLSGNSRPIKRSRNGYEMGSLEGGTGMKKSSPSRKQARLPLMQPLMNQISQNDHMHPARSPSEIVRSRVTTETQHRMPAPVSDQAQGSSAAEQIAVHKQGMLLANSERPYQEIISPLTQPLRTFSAQSNMPTQMGTRLLRKPTEAELAPHRERVHSMWKSAFPFGRKSSQGQ